MIKLVRKIFNYLLIRILPKGAYLNYQYYVYNINPKNYDFIGEHVLLLPPLYLSPRNIELGSFTNLQTGVQVIASSKQKIIIKKYTSISAGTIIIPGAHTPTVGLPQYLSYTGINDVNGNLVIPEDVWIGVRCVVLPKAKIGRGCVIGAGSIVNKSYTPYSVIAGVPAKIVGVRFTLNQVLAHEGLLYPEKERLSESYLRELFENEYKGLHAIGIEDISSEDATKLSDIKNKLNIEIF